MKNSSKHQGRHFIVVGIALAVIYWIIEAAACILPLTESVMIDPEMGTRHRAALGLSEETDALIVVVSEETHRISVAEHGRLVNLGQDEMALRRFLNDRLFISSGD